MARRRGSGLFVGRTRGTAGVAALAVMAVVASGVQVADLSSASASTPAAAGEYVPLTQARIVDSRIGQGLAGGVTAGTVSSFQVLGQGGVPSSGVSAVVLTVTTISPSNNTWATLWAQGATQPVAGLNCNASQTMANTFITKVGATSGKVSTPSQI